jgi:hypothetical protein
MSVSQLPHPAPISENQEISLRVVDLLSSPTIQITIPQGSISSDEVANLLKKVAVMTSEAVKMNDKAREKELFENGYRKGVGAALLICNPMLWNDMTNWNVVDSQTDCSPFVKETLSRMAGLSPPIKKSPLLWEKPAFIGANGYIRQYGLKERKKIMGYIDNEEVLVLLVGHVETQVVQEDDIGGFFGRCEMAIPGEPIKHGFVLGRIYGTGTAVIVDQYDKLYAYSPEDAIGPPWGKMTSDGAEIKLDSENNISLLSIPGMLVASLGEW